MVELSLSQGIIVKPMEMRHAQAFFDFTEKGREHFVKWIPFVSRTKEAEDIKRVIQLFLDKNAKGNGFLYGLWDKTRVIGILLVREIDEGAKWAEIGYMVDPDYEGRGIIKEGCRKLIAFLFDEWQMQKIVICCDDRNVRSIELAKKLGFVCEGNLRRHSAVGGELCNLMHFGLLREEEGAR